jgi:hypothetical protein
VYDLSKIAIAAAKAAPEGFCFSFAGLNQSGALKATLPLMK